MQRDLFPLPTGFRPDPKQSEPRLWISELRVYRSLSATEGDLLRSIVLKPGLNILWAKPRERSTPTTPRAPGISGHASGKTTFCRFLRYVLGETTFGDDEQRERIRTKFPEGWVVAEVHLDGVTWLVRRPFKVGGPPHLAFGGLKMNSLFATEKAEKKVTFDEFRQKLTQVLAEPLPIATFATSPTPIEWAHLLQWLTRDQECRFAGLAEVRHSSSDSQSPTMTAEDTHFLFRAVLGLIDTPEQAEIEQNKRLLVRKQKAEHDAPLLRYRSDSACERLRSHLSDFREELMGTDFLEAVTNEWTARASASAKQLETMQEPGAVEMAREELIKVRGSLRDAEARKRAIEWSLARTEQQLKQLRGGSSSDLDSWLRSNAPPDTLCGRTLAEAIEWECPLAAGRKLPIESAKAEVPTEILIEQLEERKARDSKRLEEVLETVAESRELSARVAEALRKETEKYDRTRASIAKKQADDYAVSEEAKRASADKAEADKLDASIKELDLAIRLSQAKQAHIREQNNAALSNFSQTFARVAKFVVDEEVDGAIRFAGRKVDPKLTHEIDLTSAALVTLKIICFDLAAMVSSVEGNGAHPRFLIHDGPREADMDREIYQRIFELAEDLQNSFGERPVNFQYIVTTTEPPPVHLQKIPWLLDPVLDASHPSGKFLGEHF
jgi:hypothetical protein